MLHDSDLRTHDDADSAVDTLIAELRRREQRDLEAKRKKLRELQKRSGISLGVCAGLAILFASALFWVLCVPIAAVYAASRIAYWWIDR